MRRQLSFCSATVLLLVVLLPAAAVAAPGFAGQQADAAQAKAAPDAAVTSGTAEEARQSQVTATEPEETRLYPVSHINLDSAYTIAVSTCREEQIRQRTACNVEVLEDKGTLVVTAIPAIHERVAALLDEVDTPPLTQTFQVIVLAATDSESMPADLPPGAQQAVDDIASFLPYRGFRLLDAGWLRTVRAGQTSLTGPTGFEVMLEFRGDPRSDEPLLISTFRMWLDDGMVTPNGEYHNIRQSIVDTSFSMDVGETVVVGTSKLNGDREPTALVILLTALEEEGTR
jgi:hypothetical protein